MNFKEIEEKIKNALTLKQVSENLWQVESDASFLNGTKISVFLENNAGQWFFNDLKGTLKYMNELYELDSADVKKSISAILKIYGFSIIKGRLVAKISEPAFILEKYFDFIMCIAQLTNMFAFFDKI